MLAWRRLPEGWSVKMKHDFGSCWDYEVTAPSGNVVSRDYVMAINRWVAASIIRRRARRIANPPKPKSKKQWRQL